MAFQMYQISFLYTLMLLSGCVSCYEYTLVPSESLCSGKPNSSCSTLREFFKTKPLDEQNITLYFEPGVHLLVVRMVFKSLMNVTLVGNSTTFQKAPTIRCVGPESGADFVQIGTLSIDMIGFTGCHNEFLQGGAIYIQDAMRVLISFCTFVDNHVNGSNNNGGAIFLRKIQNVVIRHSIFISNSAIVGNYGGGGAIHVASSVRSVSIQSSHFESNQAFYYGGAIQLDQYVGNISFSNTLFVNNSVSNSFNKEHKDIEEFGKGGAISTYRGYVFIENTVYIGNRAQYGGAIYAKESEIMTSQSNYTNNAAYSLGGAMYIDSGRVTSFRNVYHWNTAQQYGGATYAVNTPSITVADHYTENKAYTGATIYQLNNKMSISKTTFIANEASRHGIINLNAVTLTCWGDILAINNTGSLYLFRSQMQITGTMIFANNSNKEYGGAVNSISSNIRLDRGANVSVKDNAAKYGGGISLTRSIFNVSTPMLKVSGNKALKFGGGIYSYRSEIKIVSQGWSHVLFSNNVACKNGGGIYAIASDISIARSLVEFLSNKAQDNGGGMFLAQNSHIYLQKTDTERFYPYEPKAFNVKLELTSNSADYGGGIYVSDRSNSGVMCDTATAEFTSSSECFLQTVRTYDVATYIFTNYINTFFKNNTAVEAGMDLYGGLLDRCTVSPDAELVNRYKQYANSTGLAYITATVNFEGMEVYDMYGLPNLLTEHISSAQLEGLVTSDAVKLCFCSNHTYNCNEHQKTVYKRKGATIEIPVIVLDQVSNPLNSTVIGSPKAHNAQLRTGQTYQRTDTECRKLEYNVYSTEDNATVTLYPDGPCRDDGVSKRLLHVVFLPCDCPPGFQESQFSSNFECICDCDAKLKPQITNCYPENHTVLRESNNIWVTFSNDTGIITHSSCPYHYCTNKPVYIDLSLQSGVDDQCSLNRSGILCGACKRNLSVIFGSSQCRQCVDYWLFLLIPFGIAGIALVSFVMILNLTVAIGTIHGLILYANILAANHNLLSPPQIPKPLTVFVSWLNLDLGIETCFYDGMDSYAKFLLQLVFPAYVLLLTVLVIVLCECSEKFAKLVGRRNPVATLCTLFLLLYSKLLRMIIEALQYTSIDYPNGTKQIVWLYDANELYFTVKHIPRFISAFLIIIIGAMYTIFLFFGQWFTHCSNWTVMKWTRNTKYISFIDAYHAPFRPKHRYWVGLLLFVRIVHYLISSFTSDATTILSICCSVVFLLLLKLLYKRNVYKKWPVCTLETTYLINILILAVAAFYAREQNLNLTGVTIASLSLAFLSFSTTILYHIYAYILKKKLPLAMRRQRRRNLHVNDTHHLLMDDLTPASKERFDSNSILREPDMDILSPVYTGDYTEPVHSPVHCQPTFTVVDGIRPNNNGQETD